MESEICQDEACRHAKIRWTSVEGDIKIKIKNGITVYRHMARNESKASREVYACRLSYDILCEELVNLKLGNMSGEKYMQKFDELKT